ncbi:M20/M25/M40 family metallo-hydrolase [Sphingomicrobium sp. XHP0239]|uniref:M20/M25/M40 family metallo-hydrolase n=1 Tax=Sphingomicrobium maritimum TaxID=3133972 RepID=UPI0031CCD626
MKFRPLDLTLGAAALTLAFPAYAQDMGAAGNAEADNVRAHVEFLADDLLEGRDAGTRGYDIAALYVASQFKAMGLQPGGDDGSWYQQVPFVRASSDAQSASLTRGGETIDVSDRMALNASVRQTDIAIDAPLVFVGNGLDEPLLGYDDYEGLDVAGKIVVVLGGIPEGQPGDVSAHLRSSKAQSAAANGAIGILNITGAEGERAARVLDFYRGREVIDWVGSDGTSGRLPGSLLFDGVITLDMARDLLGVDADGIRALAQRAGAGEKISRDLGAELSVALTSTHERFTSPNVIATLPGGDADKAGEHVMMTAHLDHVGVNEDALGADKVFNGALDNAAGVSTMLEAARLFTRMDRAPDRTITFIALTAEEKGLLGAGYYAAEPTVPLEDIAAVVNLDMPVPLYEFIDVVAFGADYNSVAQKVAAAGEAMGVSVVPDPMPEQNIFVRSDHYRFAEKGIPAILLFTGPGGEGEEKFGDFFANQYHQAGDDLSLPIMWDQLARYADLNYRIALTIAEDEDRPRWYADTYFGDRFAPGQERAPRP